MIPTKASPDEIKVSKLHVVYTLCLISFLEYAATLFMAPFFSIEAKKKGVEMYMIGLILSISPAVSIFSSYICGNYLLTYIAK